MGIHYSEGTLGYKLSERDVVQNKSSLVLLKCTQTFKLLTSNTEQQLFLYNWVFLENEVAHLSLIYK